MIKRNTLASALLLLLCLPLTAQASGSYGLAAHSGRVEVLDFASSTMIVAGLRYRVAVDAKVEIAGSYGSFTMLRIGMPIYYEYQVVSPTERRIVLIRELPPDVKLAET